MKVVEDDLAFALALAARAGEVLMDRYERLERIDHKSARDVVTEADHLSEGLIISAIRSIVLISSASIMRLASSRCVRANDTEPPLQHETSTR